MVFPEKLGWGVRPTFWNHYPISDQNLRFSLPHFIPDQKLYTYFRPYFQIYFGCNTVGLIILRRVLLKVLSPGTHDPEPTTPIYSTYICHGIFTDRSIFRLPFPNETKAVPVRWPYDVRLVSCNWSSGSGGGCTCEKFNLKISRSVKTPWHEHNRVVGSGSWVPVIA